MTDVHLQERYYHRTRTIIGTLEEIGQFMGGWHRNTIARWIKEHGFPATQLPAGTYITTPALIDGWILTRGAAQAKVRKAKEQAKISSEDI